MSRFDLSFGDAWPRHPFFAILPAAFAVTLLTIIASVGYLLTLQTALKYSGIETPWPIAGWAMVVVGIAIGAFAASCFIYFFSVSRAMMNIVQGRFLAPDRVNFMLSLLVILVFALIIPIALVILLNSTRNPFNADADKVLLFLKEHSGGAVGFVISTTSLVIFIMTIHQLRDLQQRIGNFSTLMRKLIELTSIVADDDPLHMIVYTPALGYLARPTGSRGWKQLYKALFGLATQGRIRMLTLGDVELWEFHRDFINRETNYGVIDEAAAQASQKHALELKAEITTHDPLARNCGRVCPSYSEAEWKVLPGYYCFFTARRAIIVAPMFLPLVGTREEGKDRLHSPDMVGFETCDPKTIDDLFRQFRYLMRNAKPAVAS